jgi:hypothetical protein
MKKIQIIILLFTLAGSSGRAQELFVFTEPASNMPAKSIGIRMANFLMRDNTKQQYNYHLLPELMVGLSKKWMIHAQGFVSNRNNSLISEGGSLYTKYRFFSQDDVHRHFRMAVLGRLSFNNSDIHQPAIDFMGHSSGYELGFVATQLLHKVAISGGVSLLHATNNGKEKFKYSSAERNALYYTFSVGKLLLPKNYDNYNQTNLNLMCEWLAQTNLGSGKTFIDMAPSVQLIISSRMRIDMAYRFALINQLQRTAANGYVLKLEYNFFNSFK